MQDGLDHSGTGLLPSPPQTCGEGTSGTSVQSLLHPNDVWPLPSISSLPSTKGVCLLAQGLGVRGLSFPGGGIPSSTQLLFGPAPRIREHHVPAITVLPHPEPDPQSQGQDSCQGEQLLIQGWRTQHHQQGQGGPPLCVLISWPAVTSVPATFSAIASFFTVSVVEVVSAVLVIGWAVGRGEGSQHSPQISPSSRRVTATPLPLVAKDGGQIPLCLLTSPHPTPSWKGWGREAEA